MRSSVLGDPDWPIVILLTSRQAWEGPVGVQVLSDLLPETLERPEKQNNR